FVPSMNYRNLRPQIDARWKFFPKTAVILETMMDFRSYTNPANPPANLLKAQTGVAGLISTKVSILVKAGWGHDFAGTHTKTPLTHAEVTSLLTDVSIFRFGGLRTRERVPFYGSFVNTRASTGARFLMGGNLTPHGRAAFDSLVFSGSSRHDSTVTFDFGPD